MAYTIQELCKDRLDPSPGNLGSQNPKIAWEDWGGRSPSRGGLGAGAPKGKAPGAAAPKRAPLSSLKFPAKVLTWAQGQILDFSFLGALESIPRSNFR